MRQLKLTGFLITLTLFSSYLFAADTWQSGPFKILPKNIGLQIYNNQSLMMDIESFAFNFVEPAALSILSTTKDSCFIQLQFNQTDGFRDDFPKQVTMLLIRSDKTLHFATANASFRHITIRMRDLNEHYFGLIEKLYPNNELNPDLRGNVVDVEVYAEGDRNYSENYASAYSAFYMSSAGYASFFDTFAKGQYRLAIDGITEIYHQTDKLDWYLFTGKNEQEMHQAYYKVIGSPKHIPIWACGPIFWRDYNKGGKDEILDDIQKFTELKIPMTGCFLDRPYSDGSNEWSQMNFKKDFANPEIWIKTINDTYGMEFMTWIAPMTFGDTNFPGLLPNYRTYMDLTNPQTLAEFESRLSRYQYSVGVKGHKMDRADENFPMTAQWHDGITESESRNKYIYLYSKVTDQFLTNAYGKDHFNFARSAFHRCQPYLSAVWGGDCRNNWQGMAGNMANAIRSSYMGFPVWGSDTGGYLGEGRIDNTLYIRWLQWSGWCGMFDIKIDGAGGSGEDRPPWKYGKEVQDVFRQVCTERMAFLPTIYSYANTAQQNGVLMKPLASCYPKDTTTYDMWDEYIFANSFLIAPIFSKENSRDIYLPEGTWIDYYDQAQTFKGPTTITRHVPMDQIPVFIQSGSMYMTGNIHQGNDKVWDKNAKKEVTLHVFPGESGSTSEFQYVDYLDEDKVKPIQLTMEDDKLILKSESLSTDAIIEVQYIKEPKSVTLNDKTLKYNFAKKAQHLSIKIKKNTKINLIVTR